MSLPVLALAAALLLLSAGCASPGTPLEGPRDPRTAVPPGVDRAFLHFTDSVVAPGDVPPDFTLPTPDGGTLLSLSTFRGRPLVLVFGSLT